MPDSQGSISILLVVMIIIILGFFAPYIGDSNIMPNFNVKTTGCLVANTPNPGADAYNQPLCEECIVRWYFWCAVGKI